MNSMNNYGQVGQTLRNQTLVIVEGELEKFNLLKTILKCFPKISVRFEDIHVYHSDIYDLYHAIEKEYDETWYEDGLEIDLPLLISRRNRIAPQLDKRTFTNIILMFDYERHDNWYSDEKILKMQKHFDNATEDGLLYINYPMAESLYHFKSIPDSDYLSRKIPVQCRPGKEYKQLVASESAVLKYVNLYGRLLNVLNKKTDMAEEKIEEYAYELLSAKTREELTGKIGLVLSKMNLLEQDKKNLEHTLLKRLENQSFLEKSVSYWEDMRELFFYFVRENIVKASSIQNIRDEICDGLEENIVKAGEIQEIKNEVSAALKEKYQEIEWHKVLERQNQSSKDEVNGTIWVLCTCITFLGEYKFFWA